MTQIQNFAQFCTALAECGFSMGGGNDKGIFALVPYGWSGQEELDTPVKWHTGNPETDPWEWRMRVLEEREDIAYSKCFFKSSGYITREWYPHFYAVRRQGESFQEAYEEGRVSHMAKRIYDVVWAGEMALHEIKQAGGFSREDSGAFDRALVELQMGLFLTMCGRTQKRNRQGEGYGWNSTVFTTVEDFWERRGLCLAALDLDPAESAERIRMQVLKLHPAAEKRKVEKFIKG